MDRTPLEQVEDREPNQEHQFDEIGSSTVDKTIDETRMMRELSLLMGFDGDGFEGNLDKALSVYRWAESRGEPLSEIKKLIQLTGEQTRGKTLVNKLYLWASLQDNIETLQERQSNLNEQ